MCDWLEKQRCIEDAALFSHKERAALLRKILEEHKISPREKYILVGPPYMRRNMYSEYWLAEGGEEEEEHKPWLSEEKWRAELGMQSDEGDAVKHPNYYNWHPVAECIEIIAEFPWCRGEAIKYIWRAGRKDPNKEIEDLKKAIECLHAEVRRLGTSDG